MADQSMIEADMAQHRRRLTIIERGTRLAIVACALGLCGAVIVTFAFVWLALQNWGH